MEFNVLTFNVFGRYRTVQCRVKGIIISALVAWLAARMGGGSKLTLKLCMAADARIVARILVLLLGVAGPRAWGDDQQGGPRELKNMTLEELSQIEVTTPSKQPAKAFATPAAIYVITGEDIRRSGATSIPEALRLAPGVEVARIDGSKWSIGIRGFGSRNARSVLVLIDGRTVYTPLFDGTYWEVQDTMMEDIDRIEVIRGPGGTIWGPNAVNGVINIITKEAGSTKGTLITAGSGNEEQGFLNARYGGGDGPVNYRVYAKGFTRSPEDHQDGRNFDDWRSMQAGFRLDWSLNARDSLTVQGDIYDQADGESVSAVSYTPPYAWTAYATDTVSGGNVLARWKRVQGDGSDIQVQAYYDRTNRYEPNFGEVRNTFDIDYLQRVRMWGRHEISFGAGARSSPARDIEVVSGLTFLPPRRTDYLVTGFFQDEVALVPGRLALTLGTKVLRTNFTPYGFEPSARLAWTPTAQQTFWAAYTHALRTPSDAEENFNLSGYLGNAPDGTPIFARFIANNRFAPEQMNGYEVGFRQLAGKNVYFDLTGFYNHYHDLFSEEITGPLGVETSPAPTHYLLPAAFRNGQRGYTKGVEIAPEWRITDGLRLRGSYSYLHMNLGREPGSDDASFLSVEKSSPAHQVSIQSAYDFTKRLQLDLDYRYVSELTGQYISNYPSVFVHGYSTADVRFGWRLNSQLEVSIVGRNLLQPSHAEFLGDPGPLVAIKRSGFVRLTWSK
jgi:iron complex outermembrane receptor protein